MIFSTNFDILQDMRAVRIVCMTEVLNSDSEIMITFCETLRSLKTNLSSVTSSGAIVTTKANQERMKQENEKTPGMCLFFLQIFDLIFFVLFQIKTLHPTRKQNMITNQMIQ